ncbi:MAG: sensor histidine kinase, partial [Bacteroidetes bacterium]|nr:sensor histidine kinase [Bacteroidota bacterium]
REEERTNMAREIHDELGQQLTLVKMNLFSLLKNNENVSPAFQEKAKEIGESINKTVDMVRRIATELRPVILDEHGLADAILSHSNEFTKRTGIKTNVDVKGINSIYDLSINTDVFRIYQESLTNIARHANATKVDAVIKTENDFLKLLITDDGNGFNMENRRNKKSLGLLMMQERAISIGGLVKIISEEGEGTSILLTIPIGNN